MKKIIVMLGLFLSSLFLRPISARAQADEIAQLALNIEKLSQLRSILKSMYDGYEVLSSGYKKVSELTSGNFKLHEVFLDGLYLVNPSIKKYQRVADIVSDQLKIVSIYKSAYNRFKSMGVFRLERIEYIGRVYGRLFDDSLENLSELAKVITANQLRMSDDERIKAIDRIYEDTQRKLHFLLDFNSQYAIQAAQIQRERNEINGLNKLLNHSR